MVSKGVIRERPQSVEEAREFIKGERFPPLWSLDMSWLKWYASSFLSTGYSDDRAFAVNFVLVTNLSTGATKGGWDIPEVTDEMSRSSQNWDGQDLCSVNHKFTTASVLFCIALRRSNFRTYRTSSSTEWWDSTPYKHYYSSTTAIYTASKLKSACEMTSSFRLIKARWHA